VSASRPRPLLDDATIILSWTGRMRYVSGRALWRLAVNEPDVTDLRAERQERKSREQKLDDGLAVLERLRWNARYLDALKYEAKPATPRGPLVPKVPSFKRLNLPTTELL